jgi:hypothetical protein
MNGLALERPGQEEHLPDHLVAAPCGVQQWTRGGWAREFEPRPLKVPVRVRVAEHRLLNEEPEANDGGKCGDSQLTTSMGAGRNIA